MNIQRKLVQGILFSKYLRIQTEDRYEIFSPESLYMTAFIQKIPKNVAKFTFCRLWTPATYLGIIAE